VNRQSAGSGSTSWRDRKSRKLGEEIFLSTNDSISDVGDMTQPG
jgi:hypothetical protein